MNTERRIVLGADHAGVNLKEKLCAHLKELVFEVINVGTFSTDSCDYPVYAKKVCNTLQTGEADLGILVCGTGVGMSMAANKYKGIRAACCSDTFSARLTRIHNNANVICIGERVLGEGLAFDIIDAFVSAEFEGGKHQRRISMFENGVEE